MIENSDRGITINKALAWAMVSGLLLGGFTLGSSIATVQRQVEALSDKVSSQQQGSDGREIRLRSLENNAAKSDERATNILSMLSRIDARLERIERAQREAR